MELHRPRFFPLLFCTLLAAAAAAAAGAGSEPSVRILTPDHPVTDALPELALVEPHLAVDPGDPRHLVAGTIVVSPAEDRPVWRCAALTSFDGGQHWRLHELVVERCIDPWVVFTRDAVLMATLEIGSADEGERPPFRTLLWRSEDDGRSWSETPLSLGDDHEHPMLVADRESGTVWAVSRRMRGSAERPRHALGVQRSSDDARSFEEIAELEPTDLGLTPTGVVRLDDGSLLVTWIDFRHDVDAGEGGELERQRVWATRLVDGRLEPRLRFVTDRCGPTEGFAGYPFLASTVSSDPGRFHHLCVRAGFDGLALVSSADGERWSAPLRVDPPPEVGTAHARTPMLATNDRGAVAVAWYGRRRDPERRCQELFFTASTDGGESFASPIVLSDTPSCPEVESNRRVARSWPMGGDYSSLAAAPNGTFHLLWADARSGRFRLHHAAVRVDASDGP